MKRLFSLFVLVFMLLSWAAITYAELTDGLVLYMPLDEGKGKTTKDFSKNKFEGTLTGNPEWVKGKFGSALQFKGAANFVFIPDNPALRLTKAMSAGSWINLDRLPSAHAIIVGTRNGGAPNRKIGFGYGMNPSNAIKVWTNNPGGGFLDINDVKTQLKPGQWYYLAFTHQSDKNGLVQIFVDGKMTHSQESNNPVDPSGAPNEVTIGTWAGEAWPGIADEVRIWNRVLTEAEINESMNKGFDQFAAVEARGKLTTTWGKIKSWMK